MQQQCERARVAWNSSGPVVMRNMAQQVDESVFVCVCVCLGVCVCTRVLIGWMNKNADVHTVFPIAVGNMNLIIGMQFNG